MHCGVGVRNGWCTALLRFPLQRLQHSEHVHGEFGELGLFAGRSDDQDLLQAERHLRGALTRRRCERTQPGTGNAEHLNGGMDSVLFYE